MDIKKAFTKHLFDLQNRICHALEKADGKAKFIEDAWERPGGGGGKTRVIAHGNVFEKGGVNTSIVHGELPEVFKEKFDVSEASFYACGLSLVIHPESPKIPTVHANWRYFEMYDGAGQIVKQWFGGGSDLTPYYLVDEDAAHFHQIMKNMCDKHNNSFYPKFKKACDAYFFNSHRDETRGIGGIFYDYMQEDDKMSWEQLLNFQLDAGDCFIEAYLPLVEKHKDNSYTDEEKYWQEIRRGRYVEFNLLHDRGTHFGIKTKGRTESILMSLPAKVRWDYDYQVQEGSEEAKLIDILMNPKDWV